MQNSYMSNGLVNIYSIGKKFKEVITEPILEESMQGKKIRIFVDVRGAMVNVHGHEGRQMLCKLYKSNDDEYVRKINGLIDSWIGFFLENNIWNYEIIAFCERGDSAFHDNLLKESGLREYKSGRKDKQLEHSPDSKMRKMSSDYVNMQLGKLWSFYASINSRVQFVFVPGLEIDFYPEFVIDYINDNHFNIILSKDKDLSQTIKFPNTIQIRNYKQVYSIIQASNCCSSALKLKVNHDARLLSLGLSIIGDQQDSVCGVAGIAAGGVGKLFDELSEEIINECDDGIRYDLALLRVIDREELKVSKPVVTIINKIKNKTIVVNDVTLTNREALELSYKLIDFPFMMNEMKSGLEQHWRPIYDNFNIDYSRIDFPSKVSYASLTKWFKTKSHYEMMNLIRSGVYIK